MERYCINLVLSWNTLVSQSMVIENFAGYSSLGWHLCSLRVCMTSAQDPLALIVLGLANNSETPGMDLPINPFNNKESDIDAK